MSTLPGTTTMLPNIKSGKIRALAISSTKQRAAAPAIPSFGEQGYPTVGGTSAAFMVTTRAEVERWRAFI
jgi:tripartite-type tricarboxylate transporter receptor subunit TctC